jgi:hypothetical protein
MMRYAGFVPTGLMHVAFAAMLCVAFKGRGQEMAAALLLAVNGLARVCAGIFPCELGCAEPRLLLSQKLHYLSASVGFLALIAACLLWGFLLRRYAKLRWLGVYSVGSGVLGLVFLALMLGSEEQKTVTGLYERLSTGVLSLWVLVFAARLWWIKACSVNPERQA